MLRKILICNLNISFLMVSITGFSQEITVMDKSSLEPLDNVAVFNENRQASALTNEDGTVPITKFKGSDTLYFQHAGYRTSACTPQKLKRENYKVYLTPRSYDMNEVVISASRQKEKKKEVPGKIETIDKKEISFMDQQTPAGLLQSTGEVQVQKSQMGGGSPVIRGFEANKVLLVVDGIRMNNAIFRGGHLQNVITIDNALLEKVEVLYGPGSVIYGSDALGGVMHFHTRDPKLSGTPGKMKFNVNANTRYATANREKSGHIDVSLGGNQFGSITSFSYSDYEDLRQGNIRNPFYEDTWKRKFYVKRIKGQDSLIRNPNVNIQKPSGYTQYDLMQKFLYRPSQNLSHTLNLQYSTTSNIPRYDRLTQWQNGNPEYAQWYYGPQERILASYHFDFSGTSAFWDRGHITGAYQNVTESRHKRRFNTPSLSHRNENVQLFSLNADLEKKLGDHRLRYGTEGTYHLVESVATLENIETGKETSYSTRYPGEGSQMQTFALYLTDKWKLSPKFILNGGIRYNFVQLKARFGDKSFFPFPFERVSQTPDAFNGSLGLVYLPGNDWRITTSASSGFRAPNVDDLAKVFNSVPGKVVVPNPNLKPEKTYNGELTLSKTIAEKVHLEATGFYTLYTNAITLQKFTFEGKDSILYDGRKSEVTANVNAKEAFLYGFHGQLLADITPSFSFRSTLNYTYGRIRTDTGLYPLDHISPVYGRTGFNLSLKKFRSSIYVLYNGWKRLKNYNVYGEDNLDKATRNGMPAWYTLNLRAAYQVNRHFRVQAALENILDRNYRVFASGISAPGRNLVISLRANF